MLHFNKNINDRTYKNRILVDGKETVTYNKCIDLSIKRGN